LIKLDASTLFVSMWVTVTLTGAALGLGVGWRRASAGLRAWGAALWLQSIGWATLMAAYSVWPRGMATLGVLGIVGSVSAMYVAAQSYLRQPVSRHWALGPPLLTTVVHWFVFDNFAGRVALVNLVIGVQMLWLAWLLLRPSAAAFGWRWRWLAGVGLMLSGPMVLGRVVIAVFSPAQYPSFESNHWLNVMGLIINNACLTIGTLAFLLAHRDEAEQELKRLATLDGLTGLLNRRTWMQRGEAQLQLARRHAHDLAVWMIDIDHFKQINDQHGHQVGDRVIEVFAQALSRTVRGSDLVGRYGGEEFCVLLPLSDADAVASLDQRLRAALQTVSAQLGMGLGFSAGAATWAGEADDLEKMIARADRALYAAKHNGRGRLEIDALAGRRRVVAAAA
jgi:diguanylate cyclase